MNEYTSALPIFCFSIASIGVEDKLLAAEGNALEYFSL